MLVIILQSLHNHFCLTTKGIYIYIHIRRLNFNISEETNTSGSIDAVTNCLKNDCTNTPDL